MFERFNKRLSAPFRITSLMKTKITFREIHEGEEEQVCLLVIDCFNEFVAPGYGKEGIIEFSKYVNPKLTQNRLANNHFIILASDNDRIAGIIEVRDFYHISLFFVRREYQNKGIGKKLSTLAIDKCKVSSPNITFIEVNSSPYAVSIYEKLGFTRTSDEQIVNGIRFTPMILKIN
jgi:ribosomal protein S18 acetylase RimI-like enzyme